MAARAGPRGRERRAHARLLVRARLLRRAEARPGSCEPLAGPARLFRRPHLSPPRQARQLPHPLGPGRRRGEGLKFVAVEFTRGSSRRVSSPLAGEEQGGGSRCTARQKRRRRIRQSRRFARPPPRASGRTPVSRRAMGGGAPTAPDSTEKRAPRALTAGVEAAGLRVFDGIVGVGGGAAKGRPRRGVGRLVGVAAGERQRSEGEKDRKPHGNASLFMSPCGCARGGRRCAMRPDGGGRRASWRAGSLCPWLGGGQTDAGPWTDRPGFECYYTYCICLIFKTWN